MKVSKIKATHFFCALVMENIEREILNKIKAKSGKVLMLPIDIWVNLIFYSESKEDYETCKILIDLVDIVVLQTFKDFIEQDDREWEEKQKSLDNKSWK